MLDWILLYFCRSNCVVYLSGMRCRSLFSVQFCCQFPGVSSLPARHIPNRLIPKFTGVLCRMYTGLVFYGHTSNIHVNLSDMHCWHIQLHVCHDHRVVLHPLPNGHILDQPGRQHDGHLPKLLCGHLQHSNWHVQRFFVQRMPLVLLFHGLWSHQQPYLHHLRFWNLQFSNSCYRLHRLRRRVVLSAYWVHRLHSLPYRLLLGVYRQHVLPSLPGLQRVRQRVKGMQSRVHQRRLCVLWL